MGGMGGCGNPLLLPERRRLGGSCVYAVPCRALLQRVVGRVGLRPFGAARHQKMVLQARLMGNCLHGYCETHVGGFFVELRQEQAVHFANENEGFDHLRAAIPKRYALAQGFPQFLTKRRHEFIGETVRNADYVLEIYRHGRIRPLAQKGERHVSRLASRPPAPKE